MRKIIIFISSFIFFSNLNATDNLQFFVKKAIENNLQLNAERKNFESAKQSKNISIPNFFQPTIFQIWRMQDKFFDLSRKNIEYMVSQEKFRAAFDFFLIRSNVDSDLLEYSNNWQDVYDNLK